MGPYEGALAKVRLVEKTKENMKESFTRLAKSWSCMSEGQTAEMGVVMALEDLSEPVKDSAI